MPNPSPEELACEICAKRHETGVATLLECRALPPTPDVGRFARYPAVRPDFYCHVYFQADAEAVAARAARRAEQARLDNLVAQTAAGTPPESPPATPVTPAPAKRGRRARAAGSEPGPLL